MRKEYVNYENRLPIKISFISVDKYPMHWHDCFEILYVLKGSLEVTIGVGTYELEEGEMEIINCDETHAFKGSKGNEVLVFKFDPNFFEKYFNDIRNVFFYTNSSEDGAQEEEKYYELRRYLSILLCEYIQKEEDFQDYIESNMVKLLYYLINNFHQLVYENDDLKDNEEQFQRYNRIIKYINNNYNNKISLQDIAKKEYLSSDYLSREIKNTFGYNFQDILNLTRIEEAIKFLIDTDMTVSDISYELGFSHIRYLNKSFKRFLKCTPLQYRKKFKIDEEKYENEKSIIELDEKDALKFISSYLEYYDRYDYKNSIIKVNIDASFEGKEFTHSYKNILNVGKAYELLKERERMILRDIQNNVKFQYAMISELFSEDMEVISKKEDFFNWYEVKNLFEFIFSIDMRPFFLIDGNLNEKVLLNLLKSFSNYFEGEFGTYELTKWKVQIVRELTSPYRDEIVQILNDYFQVVQYFIPEISNNPIYDTSYMIPYIIQNAIDEKPLNTKAFDSIASNDEPSNEIFFGDHGIVNQQGINKPAYYAYYFLSKLGNEIIENGEGYIVAKEDEDIKILLYSYGEDINKLISFEDLTKKRGRKKTAERQFSLNITNLHDDYNVIRYKINENVGSAYNYWVDLGKPTRLSEDEIEFLKNASSPDITLKYSKKSTVYNIISKIKGYGAILFILNKVQKCN